MVGAAGREAMTVDVSSLMAGNRSLTGVFLGAEIGDRPRAQHIQRLIDEAARGEFKVVIDKTFPLSEAAAAHAYIESRQAVGRVPADPVAALGGRHYGSSRELEISRMRSTSKTWNISVTAIPLCWRVCSNRVARDRSPR